MGLLKNKKVSLHDALKASYANTDEQKSRLAPYNFERDASLSNDNQQVYINKKKNKLLFSVTGTHNISDVGTDLMLAGGLLKTTKRYKEADNTLKKAQEKYKPNKTVIIGHSLGGSIAQGLHNRANKTITVDSGYTLGQKTYGESIRHRGDLVSVLGAGESRTIGKKSKGILYDHDIKRIKNENIFI